MATKVTLGTPAVHETPAPAVATDPDVAFAIDARGRKIEIRRPELLSEFHFIEAAGEASNIQTWIAMAMPLIYLWKIDGIPVSPMTTKLAIDGQIKELGHDGYRGLMAAIDVLQDMNKKETKESVKNS